MSKQKQRTSWIKFMNRLGWEGITVWEDINEQKFQEEFVKCKQWCLDSLVWIPSGPIRTAFKEYYLGKGLSTPHEYTKKTNAEIALHTLYTYQIHLVGVIDSVR